MEGGTDELRHGLMYTQISANIVKCMYSTRYTGGPTRSGVYPETQLTPSVVTPLIHTLDTSRPDKYKRRRKESNETNDT